MQFPLPPEESVEEPQLTNYTWRTALQDPRDISMRCTGVQIVVYKTGNLYVYVILRHEDKEWVL